MDLNKMTESLQNAFISAQTLAVQHNHQEVYDAHLLLALLEHEAIWRQPCLLVSD